MKEKRIEGYKPSLANLGRVRIQTITAPKKNTIKFKCTRICHICLFFFSYLLQEAGCHINNWRFLYNNLALFVWLFNVRYLWTFSNLLSKISATVCRELTTKELKRRNRYHHFCYEFCRGIWFEFFFCKWCGTRPRHNIVTIWTNLFLFYLRSILWTRWEIKKLSNDRCGRLEGLVVKASFFFALEPWRWII